MKLQRFGPVLRNGARLVIVLAAMTMLAAQPAPAFAQPATPSALYRVTFNATWSQASHPHPDGPASFPGNAHFSPLIGATHSADVHFWALGELASAGIEQMAETGGTSGLREEIAAAGSDALDLLQGGGAQSPGDASVQRFQADLDHPLVTLVTMIAPSPDWFVGVHGLSLLDEQGAWRETITVTLIPYDAGSDDGIDYRSANAEPATHQPIANMQGVAPFSNEPIGTFTFERIYEVNLPLVLGL